MGHDPNHSVSLDRQRISLETRRPHSLMESGRYTACPLESVNVSMALVMILTRV
jgi:hypothetical protein